MAKNKNFFNNTCGFQMFSKRSDFAPFCETVTAARCQTAPLVAILREAITMIKALSYAVVALMLTPAISAAQDYMQDYNAEPSADQIGDAVAALRYWMPFAERGFSIAQNTLGEMYEYGFGVPQDYAEAARWYRAAAEQDDRLSSVFAKANLGTMYYFGRGVPQDYAEAARWYRAAAEQDFPRAQNTLGVMYYHGQGVLQDYGTATLWYRAAAEQDFPHAQTNLGVMYLHGRGVPQDYGTAHMWFNIAGANEHQPGSELRDSVASSMTPADISEAQRRARECMRTGYCD